MAVKKAATKRKTKLGRPTSYRVKYDEIAIKHLGKGYSLASLPAEIPVNIDTIYQWRKQHASFADSIKRGQAMALKFYENLLIKKLSDKKITRASKTDPKNIDTSCLIFTLKTRFHGTYGDVTKHEIAGAKIEINIDKDDAEL